MTIDISKVRRLAAQCGAIVSTGDYREFTLDQLLAFAKAVEAEVKQEMQAKIDTLMLEHCPEEMTDAQMKEWQARVLRECLQAIYDDCIDTSALDAIKAGYEAQITFLWNIIDNIDTADDIAKSDDKLYRSIVQQEQKKRWETGITTDGYSLSNTSALEQAIRKAKVDVLREFEQCCDPDFTLGDMIAELAELETGE